MGVEIDMLAQIVWDYHKLSHKIEKADLIWVLGSMDTRAAEWGAELYLYGWAPVVLITGGLGRHTEGRFEKSEAELFAEIMIGKGVLKEKIWLETKSTNTGENMRFGYEILKEKQFFPKTILMVTKPYMQRRAYATFMKQWPGDEVKLILSSEDVSFYEYILDKNLRDKVINAMVGDLQRIKIYAEIGLQIPQDIPEEVQQTYERLIDRGYSTELFRGV